MIPILCLKSSFHHVERGHERGDEHSTSRAGHHLLHRGDLPLGECAVIVTHDDDPRTLECRQLLFRFAILLDPPLVGGLKLLLVLKPLQILDFFHVLPFQIFGDPLRRNFTANNSRFFTLGCNFNAPASEQPCRRFVTCEQSRRYRLRQRSRRQKIPLTRDWP